MASGAAQLELQHLLPHLSCIAAVLQHQHGLSVSTRHDAMTESRLQLPQPHTVLAECSKLDDHASPATATAAANAAAAANATGACAWRGVAADDGCYAGGGQLLGGQHLLAGQAVQVQAASVITQQHQLHMGEATSHGQSRCTTGTAYGLGLASMSREWDPPLHHKGKGMHCVDASSRPISLSIYRLDFHRENTAAEQTARSSCRHHQQPISCTHCTHLTLWPTADVHCRVAAAGRAPPAAPGDALRHRMQPAGAVIRERHDGQLLLDKLDAQDAQVLRAVNLTHTRRGL